MADHAEHIANFVAVSGATAELAQVYFEASNWDINVAGAIRVDKDDEGYVDEDDDEDDDLAQSAPKSASKK
ncbi:hypothetical protein BG003_000388 [Podila horticola]|nr:hypothetical protein BG003_000388 [Podila horticola]